MTMRREPTMVQHPPTPTLFGKRIHALRHMVDQLMTRNQKPQLLPREQAAAKERDNAIDVLQKTSEKAVVAAPHYPLVQPRLRPLPVVVKQLPTSTKPASLQGLQATAPNPHLPLFAKNGRVFFCKL